MDTGERLCSGYAHQSDIAGAATTIVSVLARPTRVDAMLACCARATFARSHEHMLFDTPHSLRVSQRIRLANLQCLLRRLSALQGALLLQPEGRLFSICRHQRGALLRSHSPLLQEGW